MLRFLHLPPVWLAALMAVGWGAARVYAPWADSIWSIAAGVGLMGGGLGLIGWAALCFRRARTSIVPRRVPDALVGDGPYRFSRNPIYLADLFILAGWCLAWGAPPGLLLTPLLWWLLREWFVVGEEAVLTERFGDDYAAYRRWVRRWI